MILQALVGLDHRQNATPGETPVPDGYSKERIGFALVIDADGRLIGRPMDLRDMDRKKPEPRAMDVPQPVKRTSGIAANFLWDKSAYVLGMEKPDPKATEKERVKRAERLPREHGAFVALQHERLAGTEDPGLRALLLFLRQWNPAAPDPFVLDHPDLLGANIVFRLDGDRQFLHQRDTARALLQRVPTSTEGGGICLVTGNPAGPARLHPAIKGVWGAQSSGASIVSFNLDAFNSYGKDQGANAPVSEAAAGAYSRALNGLLERGSRRRVQIGDASTVFWAERDAPAEEAEVGSWLGLAVDGAAAEAEVDRNETDKLFDVMQRLAVGRPVREDALELDPAVRFYVLGLSPNAARLSVRFWHVDTLGGLAGRFLEHLRDLWIEPNDWTRPPALWRLLVETAVERKSENVPKHVAGELTRAILTGGRYPGSLLAAVIRRMRADQKVTQIRAAICKACINRSLRWAEGRGEVAVARDLAENNPGYRLGRLFAVLESVQLAGIGKLNSTIRDKYYGSASASPGSVFPLILKNSKDHLKSVRTKKGDKLANWFDRQIGEIVSPMATHFPRVLTLHDQGRFAIGYYHEREALYRGRGGEVVAELKDADVAETAEED